MAILYAVFADREHNLLGLGWQFYHWFELLVNQKSGCIIYNTAMRICRIILMPYSDTYYFRVTPGSPAYSPGVIHRLSVVVIR